MFKALLKKQFMELALVYFPRRNKKKSKNGNAAKKSKGLSAGMVVLLAFLWFSMAAAFFGMSELFAMSFIPAGLAWLYFSVFGLIVIFVSVLGSVFNTYSALFHAKDNEMLLSMPIKPSMLLSVRMISVYVSGLLWGGMVWIPAIIVYCLRGQPSVVSILFCVILFFLVSLVSMVFSCLLGWIVALVSGKVRNKNIVTVVLSLVLLVAYYYVYFRINEFIRMIAQNKEQVGGTIKTWAYPVYQLGLAATGESLPMLIFALIAILSAAVCLIILSKTFVKIATTNNGNAKKVYVEKGAKVNGVRGALVKKEMKKFVSSPTFMLNSGLGTVMLIAVAVIAVIKRDQLNTLLSLGAIPGVPDYIKEILNGAPLIMTSAVLMVSSMCSFTAPSISLEGKKLWIIRSSPIRAIDVIRAKIEFHLILVVLPCTIATLTLAVIAKSGAVMTVMMLATTLAFVWFEACAGLALNLKKPQFDWTNEAVPIKQGMPVMICMLGGMIVSLLVGGGHILLALRFNIYIKPFVYLLIFFVLFVSGALLLTHWLKTKGAEIFDNL